MARPVFPASPDTIVIRFLKDFAPKPHEVIKRAIFVTWLYNNYQIELDPSDYTKEEIEQDPELKDKIAVVYYRVVEIRRKMDAVSRFSTDPAIPAHTLVVHKNSSPWDLEFFPTESLSTKFSEKRVKRIREYMNNVSEDLCKMLDELTVIEPNPLKRKELARKIMTLQAHNDMGKQLFDHLVYTL